MSLKLPPIEGSLSYVCVALINCFWTIKFRIFTLQVNCTQCASGTVEEIYETGSVLRECGVISGFDMTVEAALTKLSYVLGKDEWTLETKKQVI